MRKNTTRPLTAWIGGTEVERGLFSAERCAIFERNSQKHSILQESKNDEKETSMQIAKAYLETLYQRRPELFPSGLNPSPLTEHDIQQLENRVGYPFPRQYQSYLQAYQVPRISTSVRFCTSHVYIRSKEKDTFVPEVKPENIVEVDFDWGGEGGFSREEYWERRVPGEEPYGMMDQFLKAGYILIGEYDGEGYFVFYDLVTAAALHIHNEEIWEEAPLDMVNDSSLVRPFMEKHASQLCPDFDTFLRLVCTGEIYHDGDMIFVELSPA